MPAGSASCNLPSYVDLLRIRVTPCETFENGKLLIACASFLDGPWDQSIWPQVISKSSRSTSWLRIFDSSIVPTPFAVVFRHQDVPHRGSRSDIESRCVSGSHPRSRRLGLGNEGLDTRQDHCLVFAMCDRFWKLAVFLFPSLSRIVTSNTKQRIAIRRSAEA